MKMKKPKAFSVSVRQAYASIAPFICATGIAGLCFVGLLDVDPHVSQWPQMLTAAGSVDLLIGLAMLKKVIILVGAIPCAAMFCTDWNSQYVRFFAIRTGIGRYIRSRYLTAMLVSFLVIFVGMAGFFLIIVLKVPLFMSDLTDVYPPFAVFAESFFPFSYILAEIFCFALFGAFNATLGMTVSAYIPNRYVAVFTPMITCYFLEEITLKFPRWINFYALSHITPMTGQGAASNLAYYIAFYAVLMCFSGFVFSRQVKRRIRNEVV
jgi:hypothetical protein